MSSSVKDVDDCYAEYEDDIEDQATFVGSKSGTKYVYTDGTENQGKTTRKHTSRNVIFCISLILLHVLIF